MSKPKNPPTINPKPSPPKPKPTPPLRIDVPVKNK